MTPTIPYCGLPPAPGALETRWNGDPVLIAVLLMLGVLIFVRSPHASRPRTMAGWAVAVLALLSPLCALSVSLFSARVGQHMILLLIAAPLLAAALPVGGAGRTVWQATAAFFVALWFWHMPVPYEATLTSTPVYWTMHISLFGTAIWLWRELLMHAPRHGFQALLAGTVTSLQMSLLGAVLTLAGHAMFRPHYLTTQVWGFSPLADQQLGGVLMWVPGSVLFLWVTVRSMRLFAGRLAAPNDA